MLPTPPDPIADAFRRGARIRDVQSLKVTVMGLGRFGGGVGVVRYLLHEGAIVTVTDLSTADQLQESLGAIEPEALAGLHLGTHPADDFTAADLVVVNPAVKRNHPMLKLAAESGAALTSEINLFWMNSPAKTVAVTGTLGKSTTASLIHAMLTAGGKRCHLGGNIGKSLLTELNHITSDDWVVLELSSFQLADLSCLGIAPDVAVVTNFFPNHLDWHGSLEDYRQAKQAIACRQQPHQFYIYNADAPELAEWPCAAQRIPFGRTPRQRMAPAVSIGADGLDVRTVSPQQRPSGALPTSCWSPCLRGVDQQENVAAAAAAAIWGCGVDLHDCREALKTFTALPHRRELVGEAAGRRFINDSKATTPQASMAALNALQGPGRLLLIAGGADKGIDLRPLVREISRHCPCVALLGETAQALAEGLLREQRSLETAQCASLGDAFHWLVQRSRPGDTLLLSPGCASFGEFLNYEQRGACFVQLARDWIDQHQ